MVKKYTKGNNILRDNDILKSLLNDPTRSTLEIVKELRITRQTYWRNKKKLEKDNVIWGYTAVIDEFKLNHVIYLILMKLKPMKKEFINLLITRLKKREYLKHNVRVIDTVHTNGEYDWIIRFSAPNHSTARQYYDTLRVIYEDYLIEKPVIVDVNMVVVSEGKINPEINDLYNFVPDVDK
ncbi:MAG: winged helix-turn-helix transcriptional regulator [Thermoplasmata archaeon]|nr:MAG: winged helix-turn-helix transcriptional regulator [Thermoplasmata archaeon]